ncbi:MAG TPA: hypothetical protein VEA69_25465 [Tepidisphaeraceae bacterium]|nr:hypothetical protein [Tepidisphaeraceae bacterium]
MGKKRRATPRATPSARRSADPNLPDTLSNVRHVYNADAGPLVETSTFVTNCVETSSRTLYGFDHPARLSRFQQAFALGAIECSHCRIHLRDDFSTDVDNFPCNC